MTIIDSTALADLSDREVLAGVRDAAQDERAASARLIALLMELDGRRLYLGEGCSSLFTYCTQVLHLSEHAAYNRIETARAARRFPLILGLVESAAVTVRVEFVVRCDTTRKCARGTSRVWRVRPACSGTSWV